MNKTLTALKGVKVGHATDLKHLTGCTLVFFSQSLPVAYKAYGGTPGTFNTDSLANGVNDYKRDGIFIAGGSYNGLSSAASIAETMVQDKKGRRLFTVRNPALSGAIILDLSTRIKHQYESTYGREAYKNLSAMPVASGNVGAGTGASVGKMRYVGNKKMGAMKAGVGSSRVDLGDGIIVTAMSVVNPVGNIIQPDGTVLIGNRTKSGGFSDFEDYSNAITAGSNTTISIVGINVDLKEYARYDRVAHLATHGQIRAIHPVHTSRDGDTVFVFSTKEIKQPLNGFGKVEQRERWNNLIVDAVGQAAATAVQQSIYDACKTAKTVELKSGYQGVIPGLDDYKSPGPS